MRKNTCRHDDFSPLRDKTLFNMLLQLFLSEFGYANKAIFAEAMIERILNTVEKFTVQASLLKPGQLLWTAVANDGRKHAYKPMKNIPQVPVVLDLITDEDLKRLSGGHAFKSVQRDRHARLLEQAFEQKGVLAQNDLAAISLWSTSSIRNSIAEFSATNNRVLPYRGTIQDIGASISHKVEIIRLFESGHLEPEICRMLVVPHSLAAVENYVQTYKNVLKLLQRGFLDHDISAILGISRKLVQAYMKIVEEHHPDLIGSDEGSGLQSESQNPAST